MTFFPVLTILINCFKKNRHLKLPKGIFILEKMSSNIEANFSNQSGQIEVIEVISSF